ncbi:WD repeat domain phosphoinositide-interacting protein 1 isoform X2 [Myotis daubentonii]|uniref:WD repeat domain phosphoinositide-interacting protein 1 isoform X2 n=1 Tax=Myotis daubentonii TaxID=98922 RepID=UPI0028738713|nr:WD repeat domain phosphoinositide-interacting protein 1 isoform X2 [Myotis daubentonii]
MEAEAADGPAGGVEAALSCFSFNQDCTSLAIGTKAGYKLFSLSSVEQLDQVHGSNEIPDVYIVERLFSSSLVVVVSHTKPRQMNVYHFKKGTEICNYSYSSNILSIRLNRQRLLVCLEESIYIHNIKDMKLLKTILDVPANPTGLCALSINHSNSYVAYPGSLTTGEIVLYDGHSLKTVCTIAAHEGTLAAITFNASGSKLASASEKGTVIRVFSVPEGQKLYEFRRGMKSRPEEPSTWSGYMGKMFMAASTYLPAQVSDMMNQDRAFATGRLTFSGQKNICTLSTIQKLPRLLVASSDGHLYIYNLDPQDGGECVLIKTHRLLGSGTTEENKENDLRPSLPQSYAATVARPSASSASTVPDNIVPWKSEGQSEAVMMRSAPQKSGHPPSGGFGENQEGGRMACDGGRRVGAGIPGAPCLSHRTWLPAHQAPQSRLPVGTGDTVYASCYWNYITAIMSMLTNHIGL